MHRSGQYLHLARRADGWGPKPLNEHIVLLISKTTEGMTLQAMTMDGKKLLLLFHDTASRPPSDADLVWTEAIVLEATAFGTASVEMTTVLRNHSFSMDRVQDQTPDSTTRRYVLRPL
jgi:hypothetical protein